MSVPDVRHYLAALPTQSPVGRPPLCLWGWWLGSSGGICRLKHCGRNTPFRKGEIRVSTKPFLGKALKKREERPYLSAWGWGPRAGPCSELRLCSESKQELQTQCFSSKVSISLKCQKCNRISYCIKVSVIYFDHSCFYETLLEFSGI